ncbi:BON domain-containing protein [Amnibacterium kyonggiense]|uniref:BON domain-containing protein n=1 Tax=Amnibacterium kyonggiense TaxID=595671 RepID=A0A4R7FKH9_9MICO|nr:BON domain-containing protein [Amnibacterium kyonggiense]TDS76863.1 BON domain-containing protein [Amnibacterium kyonggiense]
MSTTSGGSARVRVDGVTVLERNGTTVLTGTASSIAELGRAVEAALADVRASAVADETVVPGARACVAPERSEEVARRVGAALDAAAVDARVLVRTDGDMVTLRGRAADTAARRVASRAAWAAPGVAYVQDWIRADRY